jgi:hypothetical protein
MERMEQIRKSVTAEEIEKTVQILKRDSKGKP